jgi:hypothetical protein
VTDWPPWLHDVMDMAVPVLFLIFGVLAIHLSARARTRNPEGEIGKILLALLWGGLLAGAILLWFLYG